MQAAEMVPSAAVWCCLQRAHYSASCSRMYHSFTAGGQGWWECTTRFCPWWPWPFTLTFKLVQARDQTRLPCEVGANEFSVSWDI